MRRTIGKNCRRRPFEVLLVLFVLALSGVLPGFAQEEGTPPEEAGGAAADAVADGSGDAGTGLEELEGLEVEESDDQGLETNQTDLAAIEDLLAQDESVLSDPDSYSYDPGTRRDPFRSLIETRESQVDENRGERPEGRAGLLIDEIVVEGVFELQDGPVAQVQSSREETSYLLRPGDQLWDGDVISINLGEVVFKQVVDDPTALKPFREVVKRLNP